MKSKTYAYLSALVLLFMSTYLATNLATALSGPGAAIAAGRIQEGNFTSLVYGYIKDEKYADAIKVLVPQLAIDQRSRAALSLLGYCHYMISEFAQSCEMYEQLCRFYPDITEYKIYLAQSAFKSCNYELAMRAANSVQEPQHRQRLLNLIAACEYEQEDLASCKGHLDQCIQEEADTVVAQGCVHIKEGDFDRALERFDAAMKIIGYQAELAYNVALCHYKTKQFGPAMKNIAEIIEKGVREHPELGIGSNTEGMDVRSVGNTAALRQTALIEAFNLKAALEYGLKNFDAAREALSDMPPRSESELDPVTLHNQGLLSMDTEPNSGFKKLNFLLSQPPFPNETFSNLVILYCKYGFYDQAADVLAQNVELSYKLLSPEIYAFLDATIQLQTSPEEAYRRFDDLASKHVEQLRKLTKQIQDARLARDQDGIRKLLKEYEEVLEGYVPVLMSMARIYWDRENYTQVEKIFRQSSEFCNEHPTWRLNVAHVFYMQDSPPPGKYREAIRYYEPFIQKATEAHGASLLSVSAMTLANLCVAYIMISDNEKAEELLRRVEKEEERMAFQDESKQRIHTVILNLVIGTLYCSKGNFEFGISRIIKSFDRSVGSGQTTFAKEKLHPDTWHHAKRCLLALVESIAKRMVLLNDKVFGEVIAFLDSCALHGTAVSSLINPDLKDDGGSNSHNTVAYEARLLKRMFLKLQD